MEKLIVGRLREKALFEECVKSGKPEFITVYGRRRIGKTFLIREYFNDRFDFYCTGSYGASKDEQLSRFCQKIAEYSKSFIPSVQSWDEAFSLLQNYLASIKGRPIIVFIDELPWLDTPRSKFLNAFEYFWNSWGSRQENLKLIVCGSATSWMTNKLLGNKGGLHNRVTRRVHLSAFTLKETEDFMKSRGMQYSRLQILETHMSLGGTPFYLDMLKKGLSTSQNIDNLFFSDNAPLAEEYTFLFKSLFNDSIMYRRIVELLAKKTIGMTRSEIVESLKISDNGVLTEVLENLESCDFIRSYAAFGKKAKDIMYQLVDLYSLFYLRYVKNYRGGDKNRWSNMIGSPSCRAWSGYAFEQVCLNHVEQIKQKLGISGVQSDVCSWRYKGDKESRGAQIDLLIDRRDQVINLCEMKYSGKPYEITAAYIDYLKQRRETFRVVTKTRKSLYLTLVTPCGLIKNAAWSEIQNELTLDDLFL